MPMWTLREAPGMWWSTIGTLNWALFWPGTNLMISFSGVKSVLASAVPGYATTPIQAVRLALERMTVITAEPLFSWTT